jgi:hypothetical protein
VLQNGDSTAKGVLLIFQNARCKERMGKLCVFWDGMYLSRLVLIYFYTWFCRLPLHHPFFLAETKSGPTSAFEKKFFFTEVFHCYFWKLQFVVDYAFALHFIISRSFRVDTFIIVMFRVPKVGMSVLFYF